MSAAVSLSASSFTQWVSLEDRLTSPYWFGLTSASPLQRAICRICDGAPLGEFGQHPSVIRALGAAHVPTARPREVAVLSGIRTGKSLWAGALGVHCTQVCDVSRLGPGEVPRVSIVSLTKDLADVVYSHISGRMRASPVLRSLLLGEPTADTILVRHPSGRPVEIKVVAGSRAGSSLTARWMAGCIFDEFPRMVGAEEGVINWDDSRKAVLERILPGGLVAHIGSPWAPFGPAYELVQEHWGKPSRGLVVVKAPAFDMNPSYWTPGRCAEAKANDEDVYRTDVLGEFSSPEEAFFAAETLAAATRESPAELEPDPACSYVAAMDPATRGNGWTLAIWTRKGRRKICVAAYEWRGSRASPLSPREVLGEVAAVLRPYRVTTIDTDQYYFDALVDLARDYELSLVPWHWTDSERTEAYLAARTRLEVGETELPPNARMRTDLLRVRKRPTQSGISIGLPVTSDGRHCDFAPVVVLGIARCIRDEQPQLAKTKHPEVERMAKDLKRRFGRRGSNDW